MPRIVPHRRIIRKILAESDVHDCTKKRQAQWQTEVLRPSATLVTRKLSEKESIVLITSQIRRNWLGSHSQTPRARTKRRGFQRPQLADSSLPRVSGANPPHLPLQDNLLRLLTNLTYPSIALHFHLRNISTD